MSWIGRRRTESTGQTGAERTRRHGIRDRALLLGVCAGLCALVPASSARADFGDVTWVQTWQQDFINWADPHVATFTFPDGSVPFHKATLHFTIGCPDAPADCDPWDRLGVLKILHDTGEVDEFGDPILEPFEIARYVTPYDITGTGRPGTCTWEIDVTDYIPLLQGEVTLSNYIESWIGGNRGWLCTLDFEFEEGVGDYSAVEVVNLWTSYHAVYGDPDRPIEDFLAPMAIDVPADIDRVMFRMFATGHGQGNTANCAEFCPRQHSVLVNSDSWSHSLWRSDCASNPCSPQGGTWPGNRAGWCPGADAPAWAVDVTSALVPGTTATVDYDVQAYTNFCCPCNPNCISGTTCADCNYNNNGHTEPNYALSGQLVYYVANANSAVEGVDVAERPRLLSNEPNPFTPSTTIRYALPAPGVAQVVIYDSAGRVARTLDRTHRDAGVHQVAWDGRDDRGEPLPAGAYFYELQIEGKVAESRKMMLVR
ncbi:MAG: T9SS type A sorting domain-containing protein [Candidatus Eisenbacteria bacterium]|nr:T9SS type A sorting domain-containing protein [Candidatus Eisenbacteria bacterium]